MEKIKDTKEYKELQQELNNYEKDYPIEFFGGIKELERVISE